MKARPGRAGDNAGLIPPGNAVAAQAQVVYDRRLLQRAREVVPCTAMMLRRPFEPTSKRRRGFPLARPR